METILQKYDPSPLEAPVSKGYESCAPGGLFFLRVKTNDLTPWIEEGDAIIARKQSVHTYGMSERYIVHIDDNRLERYLTIQCVPGSLSKLCIISPAERTPRIVIEHVEGDTYRDLTNGGVLIFRIIGQIIWPRDAHAIHGQILRALNFLRR